MKERDYHSRIVCIVFIDDDALVGENGRVQLSHRNGYGWHHWRTYFRPSPVSVARWRCIAEQKLAAGEWGERQGEGYRITGDAWLPEEPKRGLTHGKAGWKMKLLD